MFGYNHDYDSDDFDLGYDEFEYGYGMNGFIDDSGDYGDEMAFHMHMMGMLDDSDDSQIWNLESKAVVGYHDFVSKE